MRPSGVIATIAPRGARDSLSSFSASFCSSGSIVSVAIRPSLSVLMMHAACSRI
jgi:hypothetical protein